MRNFIQVASGIDVHALNMEIKRQPFLWNKNPARLSRRGPHYETSDIYLRYRDETENFKTGDFSNYCDEHIPVWYKSIENLPSAKKLIFDLMSHVKGEMLGGVLIYRVRPGEQIYPHIDSGWHCENFEKYNICLESNDRAAFCYEGEMMFQQPVDVHWFCNTTNHWVVNKGDTDHIILTVCIMQDKGYRAPWSPEGWTMDAHLDGRN